MSKKRTLLVDASFLMKQSFNGASNVYTQDGHIGGLYSFMTIVRMLLNQLKFTKVILFWDGDNSGKMRYDIYNGYKSNRKGKSWYNKIELTDAEIKREEDSDKSFLKQKIRVNQYAEELFLRQIEVDEMESDDLIAYYCSLYHKEEEITIYTNDRDFCQLLDLDISIYISNLKELIDRDNYFMHFDHHHSNVVTMKIICGCTSDKIEGIEGVKEKTLMNHFPKLAKEHVKVQEIMEGAKLILKERKEKKLKPLKALENIINGRDIFIRNKKLVDLKKPFLSEEARKAVKDIYSLPLDDENRGSKNLLKLMTDDKFFSIYNGTFVDYVTPFYVVIAQEKEHAKKYK